MAEWLAPFHRPKMTTEQFKQKKKEYVAKYGYRYSIPGFDDVIHLKHRQEITKEEEVLWKDKKFGELGDERVQQIKDIKARRKEKYLDMLGSPSPEFFENRGSVIGAIDDAQDAMSTVAAIGIAAAIFLPATMVKFISTPLSILMFGKEFLDMLMKGLAPEMACLNRKRAKDRVTENNLKNKKASIVNAKNYRDLGSFKGAAMEALQVTDNIFGFGLSLGMVMSMPERIISGAVRRSSGRPVTVNWGTRKFSTSEKLLQKAASSIAAIWQHPHNTDDDDLTLYLLAQNAITQGYQTQNEEFDPYDEVGGVPYVAIEAPLPTSIITQEILQEEDPEGLDAIGWPSTGKRWDRIYKIVDSSRDIVKDNMDRYLERNKHNLLGFLGMQQACQSSLYSLETFSEDGTVQYDYTAQCKTSHALLNAGYLIKEEITEEQKDKYAAWLQAHESVGTCPTTPEALAYATNECGFSFELE